MGIPERLNRRVQALEAKGRRLTVSRGHPYWINENKPYEQRIARYRAYFEAL